MTGFGKVTAELPSKKVTVEIKTLNSKQLDLSVRIPTIYKDKELALRSQLLQTLERGKVEFGIYFETIGTADSPRINQDTVIEYFEQLKAISEKLGIPAPSNWTELQPVLRLPDVVKTDVSEPDETEWEAIQHLVDEAIAQLNAFRIQEGAMLERLFREKIANISALLEEIGAYEKERIDKIKTRIEENLEKLASQDYDKNRFEQEMIYYIEKLDINEEKNRLDNHLKYFLETLDNEHGQGKKLGFITQEMGREINTMGSKSNHAEMQKIVVKMKDELEQIKEQVLNVL